MKQTHHLKIFSMLFVVLFLTSCGFHTPYKNNSVNVTISGESDFTSVVQSKLDTSVAKNLTLKINSVDKNKTDEIISSAGVLKYNLELVIDFSVYKGKKVIFNNILTASRYLNNVNNSASSYQEQQAYEEMKNELADKIIRKISRL